MPTVDPTEIIPPNQNPAHARYNAMWTPSFSGVLSSRAVGFCVDFVAIGLLVLVVGFVTVTLGFFTFGLSWFLLPILFPLVALLYNGITISGPGHGTWGMRMTGVEMRMRDGSPVPFVIAAVHAIFFYVSVSFLTPFILLVGFFRNDRRMLHDLLAGMVAVRRTW